MRILQVCPPADHTNDPVKADWRTGFWSHLVYKNKDINDQERLQEIIRAAALWRQYWNVYSDGGKSSNPTMAKLNQIELQEEAFGWQQVLHWAFAKYRKAYV